MHLPDIKTADVTGKTVFLRADLDVPLTEGTIEDDTRLRLGLPTLKYLLENQARVVIGGKLGRPEGENYESRSKNQELSLLPVAKWISKKLEIGADEGARLLDKRGIWKLEITRRNGFEGWEIGADVFLLENLQFYSQERKNDPVFAASLADLSQIYVNDAFAVCHRQNASVVGIPALLPSYAGFHLQEEVRHLSRLLENPKRPLVVIIGGAKVETKLPLVKNLATVADWVLVGGKIAKEITQRFPNVYIASLNSDGTDILEVSIDHFKNVIQEAGTIIWNGPLGQMGSQETERGTREIAQAIATSSAYKVVGGGDTTEFLRKIGLADIFDFCSTGGGAMLAFLSGENLPGLEALLRS